MERKLFRNILNLDSITSKIQSFIESRLQLVKIEIRHEIAQSIAQLIPVVILLFFGSLVFIFGGVALGYWLSHLMESTWKGFAILAAGYFFIFVFFLILKNTKGFKIGLSNQLNKLLMEKLPDPKSDK